MYHRTCCFSYAYVSRVIGDCLCELPDKRSKDIDEVSLQYACGDVELTIQKVKIKISIAFISFLKYITNLRYTL